MFHIFGIPTKPSVPSNPAINKTPCSTCRFFESRSMDMYRLWTFLTFSGFNLLCCIWGNLTVLLRAATRLKDNLEKDTSWYPIHMLYGLILRSPGLEKLFPLQYWKFQVCGSFVCDFWTLTFIKMSPKVGTFGDDFASPRCTHWPSFPATGSQSLSVPFANCAKTWRAWFHSSHPSGCPIVTLMLNEKLD